MKLFAATALAAALFADASFAVTYTASYHGAQTVIFDPCWLVCPPGSTQGGSVSTTPWDPSVTFETSYAVENGIYNYGDFRSGKFLSIHLNSTGGDHPLPAGFSVAILDGQIAWLNLIVTDPTLLIVFSNQRVDITTQPDYAGPYRTLGSATMVNTIPEPGTSALLLGGLFIVGLVVRRAGNDAKGLSGDRLQ